MSSCSIFSRGLQSTSTVRLVNEKSQEPSLAIWGKEEHQLLARFLKWKVCMTDVGLGGKAGTTLALIFFSEFSRVCHRHRLPAVPWFATHDPSRIFSNALFRIPGRHEVIKACPSLWKSVYFLDRESLKVSRVETTSTSSKKVLDEDWKASYIDEEQRTLLSRAGSIHSWKAHNGRVNCCKMVMGVIASGSSDQMARIWRTDTLNCVEQYKVPRKASIVQIDFDENKVIGAAGKEVLVWSRRGNQQVLRQMGGHSDICSMFYADPDIIVGCADGTVRVLDMYSGRCTQMFRQHAEPVKGVVMDIGTHSIVSASTDGTVQLYDAQSGQKIASLLRPSSMTGITCLQLSTLNQTLFAGAMGGDLYCFDLRNHKTLWKTRVGGNSLTCMHIPSYSASVIAIGGVDGIVKLLEADSGRRLTTFRSKSSRMPSPILSVALGMTRVVTSHADSTMGMYVLGPT